MAAGKKLRETREEKGLTLEDAAKGTKIRKKYILALENDDYTKIPGQVYVRAFLKTYATYLDIDPEEILQEFELDKQLEGVEKEGLGRKRRSKKHKSFFLIDLFSKITGKVMIILIILLLLAGVVGYNIILMDRGVDESTIVEEELELRDNNEEFESSDEIVANPDELDSFEESTDENLSLDSEITDENSEETDEINLETEDSDQEETSEGDTNSQEDNPTSEAAEETEELEEAEEAATDEEAEEEIADRSFNIFASGESWVRVTVDGEVEYEGILSSGDTREFEPEEQVLIRVGNASAISIEYQGDELGSLGESGQVVEETYTF
ncbi:MAG: helix-turn-helix domain-containing protein [Bacillota bacterium]